MRPPATLLPSVRNDDVSRKYFSVISCSRVTPSRRRVPVRFEDEVVALDRTELTTETCNKYHLLLDFDVATEGGTVG